MSSIEATTPLTPLYVLIITEKLYEVQQNCSSCDHNVHKFEVIYGRTRGDIECMSDVSTKTYVFRTLLDLQYMIIETSHDKRDCKATIRSANNQTQTVMAGDLYEYLPQLLDEESNSLPMDIAITDGYYYLTGYHYHIEKVTLKI